MKFISRSRYGPVLGLVFLIASALPLSAVSAYAQGTASLSEIVKALGIEPPESHMPVDIGGGIAGVFNAHTTELSVFRTATPLTGTVGVDPVCAYFKGGNSIMPDAWLLYERPLGTTPRGFWIAPRLHVLDLSGQLLTYGSSNVDARDPATDKLEPAQAQHTLDASILAVGLDLFIKFALPARVFVFGGASGYYLLRSDATETERVVVPENAVFADTRQPERTLMSGPIPNVRKLQASYSIGGNIDIPLSHSSTGLPRVFFTPEASITFPITDLRSDLVWRLTRVAVGASIKFDVSGEEPLLPPPVVQRAPVLPKPIGKIEGSLALNGVIDSAGQEIEVPDLELRVEETEELELFPLVNTVFFKQGESAIPARYASLTPAQADSFRTSQLSDSSDLTRYRYILNILGRRLRQNPSVRMTLVGSAPTPVSAGPAVGQGATPKQGTNDRSSSAPSSSPAAQRALGLARANAVKDYLVSVWGIEPSRLTTQQRDLPPNASTSDSPEGIEENERVALLTDSISLLAPIRMSTVERSLNIPKLRIRTAYTSKFPLALYSLSLTQGDEVLAQFNSAHNVQDWTPTENQLPATNEPLAITLSLRDSIGTTFIARDTARVEQLTIRKKREERVQDKILERYNLVTFDFDKADLDARSRLIIEDIARHVTAGDKITLRGYTDLLGEPAHNLQLSQNRAHAVSEALREAIGEDLRELVTIDAAGEGRANLVDNRYPEGRFLSRTVQILIERPIQ